MATKKATEQTANIYERISKVQAEVTSVPKKGRNKHFGYDYHKESDILNAIRAPLQRHGVAVTVTEDSVKIENGILYGTIQVRYTNVEEPEDFILQRWTCGASTILSAEKGTLDDKATAKAFTGAVKQAVAKMFGITDDVDNDLDGEGYAKQTTPVEPRSENKTTGGVSGQGAVHKNTVTTKETAKNGNAPERSDPYTPDKIAALIQKIGSDPKYSESANKDDVWKLYTALTYQVFPGKKNREVAENQTRLLIYCLTGQRTTDTLTKGHIAGIYNWLKFDGKDIPIDNPIIKAELRACYDKWELGK